MKKVAGQLKIIYSQYRELKTFAQFGSDLDADTRARLAQGERIVEILKQDKNSPVPVEYQVAIIYATVNGYLDGVRIEDVKKYESELFDFIDAKYNKLMRDIKTTGALSEENEELLKNAVHEFTAEFSRENYETRR